MWGNIMCQRMWGKISCDKIMCHKMTCDTMADADGKITLTDLRDIASWASDESSTDFINNLVNELPQDEAAPITSTDFVLAFARWSPLCPCRVSLCLALARSSTP
jgi:hypothetical protein